jgi:Ca2+-binding RTX toxin-like protein
MAVEPILVAPPSTNARANTDAINAAIIAANAAYLKNPSAGPVTVLLAKGTYLVTGDPNNPSTGAVELMSGVALVGSGADGARESTIKLVDHFDARINGIVRTKLENVENVTVSNLVIDGNRANNTGHQAGFICGIKEDGSGRKQTNITLDNVEIQNCTAYGFNPHELTYNMTVKNSVSHHNGLDGFVADAVVGGVYENNKSYENDRHGFNIQNETRNLVLKDNEAYNNGFRYMYNGAWAGGAGVTIQRGNIPPANSTEIPWVTDVQIIGGSYHNNGKEGVLVKLSDHVTIDKANIYGNMRQGVKIEGSTHTIVQNSRVSNNSQEADNIYDEINIRLRFDDDYSQKTYYATDTQILNNTIFSDGAINARYGIREEGTNDDGGPTRTALSNNTISGMDSGTISVPNYSNVWIGDAGDNRIDGSTGGDDMRGAGGNDTYTVNHSGDLVTEKPGEGSADHVLSSITYTLTANVENLTLTGTRAINGYGNELANILTGNALVNVLKSAGGNDTLDGKEGADSMDGGDGNDTYFVDNASDIIVEKANSGLGGTDTVYSSVSFTLSDQVENLFLTGTAANGIGNSSNNTLTGNDQNNLLDGMLGNDRLEGRGGDDIYGVNTTSDVVVEAANAGTDQIRSTVSYTLSVNVENLTLEGTGAINGTGNDLGNKLLGNSAANILKGGIGADVLDGAAGADTLTGGTEFDTFVFRKGEISGDIVTDFIGNGANAGDRLIFQGFTAGSLKNSGDIWTVTDGAYTATFQLKGVTSLHATDYEFRNDLIL